MQTIFGKGGQLAGNAGFLGKPDNFQADLDRYRKVTPADVQRVANTYLTANRLVMSFVPRKGDAPRMNAQANTNKYLTPDKMAIVIVGDRKVIEPGLKQLEFPIVFLDTEGNPVE